MKFPYRLFRLRYMSFLSVSLMLPLAAKGKAKIAIPSDSIIYYLPKTSFNVEFSLRESFCVRG